MDIFFLAVIALILGYVIYGGIVDRIFGAEPNRVLNGIIISDSPHQIELKTSYLEDAGIVTEKVKMSFDSETHGTGTGKWYWSDGLMSCGGSFQFTVTK